MAKGVTDKFQEDLDSMVGGGLYHPDEEKSRPSDGDFDWVCPEDEEDKDTKSGLTRFDELD